MKIFDFLQNFDIFGQKVELNLGNDPEYKTKVGGCTTLSIVGVLVFFTYSAVSFLK